MCGRCAVENKAGPISRYLFPGGLQNLPVKFEALAKDGAEEAGFIAQELYEVLPMAAHAPADESKGIWTVSYNQVIPYTVKAVQELKVENDQLRSELNTLKAELAEIKALLKK